MGLFDTDNTDMFGGFFDFDDDGKVSWDEEFIAHKIIADCIEGEEDDKLDYAIYDESVSFDAGAELEDEPETEDVFRDGETLLSKLSITCITFCILDVSA